MESQNLQSIQVPTALVDREQAIRNIQTMAEKTRNQNIRFRPHFKTHQSAAIGKWFRDFGVNAITVSSVRMAEYFAENQWDDILVAFPVNLRELGSIEALAKKIKLSLLVESIEAARHLDMALEAPVDIWIKIDTGMGRAGMRWVEGEEILNLCHAVTTAKNLRLAGLLTHAGQTYHADSASEVSRLYEESWMRLKGLQGMLRPDLGRDLELSVGDTPGCWLSGDLGEVDEIRPGNFLLFDAMMLDLGVCRPEEVALAAACPVVAKHADRNEVVVYGGAVHLSKEFLPVQDGMIYGYAVELSDAGWDFKGRGNHVLSLSQEHGVLRLEDAFFEQVKIGGLLGILPAHSCLVVDLLGSMVDLQGRRYSTLRSR